jgi:hypothetical protein
MRSLVRRLAPALWLSGAVNCAGTDPSDFGRCTGKLQLTIQRTADPEFRWEPADCPVYSISIAKSRLPDTGWYLEMIEYRNGIESPVRYGVVPSGAYGSPAEQLHGGPYRLIIARLNGSSAEIVADTTFNPP